MNSIAVVGSSSQWLSQPFDAGLARNLELHQLARRAGCPMLAVRASLCEGQILLLSRNSSWSGGAGTTIGFLRSKTQDVEDKFLDLTDMGRRGMLGDDGDDCSQFRLPGYPISGALRGTLNLKVLVSLSTACGAAGSDAANLQSAVSTPGTLGALKELGLLKVFSRRGEAA